MRPPLVTEGGDGRLHHTAPRDATERRRRLTLAITLASRLHRRPDLAADVDMASAWRFLRAEGAVLAAHLDAEQARLGGAA